MIEIQTYQNRQGLWTATVTISEINNPAEIPSRVSYQVKPQDSHEELLTYLATRIVAGGKVLIRHDKGIL